MSQWILKSALDSIPVSFEQLAQLLADGGICETDLVRPENNENWQYVDSVVGLCRAAENLRSSKAPCDSSRDRIVEVEVDPTNASKVTTPKTSGAVSNAAEPGSTPDGMTQTIVAVPAQHYPGGESRYSASDLELLDGVAGCIGSNRTDFQNRHICLRTPSHLRCPGLVP